MSDAKTKSSSSPKPKPAPPAKVLTKEDLTDFQSANGGKYGGNCNIIGAIGGAVRVNITDGTVANGFTGKGFIGGVTLGVYGGELYTDDIERLYRDTISWAVFTISDYFGIYFFDGYSNRLGTFQAGGISLGSIVIGGGTGGWDHK